MIHEALVEYYSKPQPAYKGSGKISCSSFGRCIRSVMLGLAGYETPDGFNAHIREVMSLGVVYEDATARVLAEKYGKSLQMQVPLRNDIWSGKLDFLITEDKSIPVIVEHKATGDKFFDFGLELPKWEHVCQSWLYAKLYKELYHVAPKILLFYRGWSSWAELELIEGDPAGYAEGMVNGQKVRRPVALETLPKRRAEFEAAYKALPSVPEIPCSSPCSAFGCTFRDSPSCRYYEMCWGTKQ